MKKLILILCLYANNIYSQNPVVDAKGGFRDFKIDGLFKPFRSQCKFDGMSPANDSVFKYIGSCCSTLYGKKLSYWH